MKKKVRKWRLFNAKWGIFQLERTIYEMRWWCPLCTWPTFGHIILILSQPVCSFSLLLPAYWRSSKYLYQFFSLWLDQAGSWTHDPWNIKHVGNHFVANIYVYIVFSRVKSDLSDQIYTMDQFEIFVQILCEEFLETNKENIEVVLRCLNWYKLFSTSTYS
jgi:hypothetical protein